MVTLNAPLPTTGSKRFAPLQGYGPRASRCATWLVVLVLSSVSVSESHSTNRPFKHLKFQRNTLADLQELESSDVASASALHPSRDESKLQRFFEVARPVSTHRRPSCSMQLLYHEFADTYGVNPPAALYIPRKKCHKKWDKVVLRWSAVCRGRQFDRIAAVWLGGVEILRTCTAEPSQRGIIWEVEKDVTRYASLWHEPQEVVVALGNVVDGTYTGIFNVTVSVDFYKHDDDDDDDDEGFLAEGEQSGDYSSKIHRYLAHPADRILTINLPTYLNGGYWFQLSGKGEVKSVSLAIPKNTYRAILEVCLSPHQNDEFWYTNPPNDYLEANNLTGTPGNGAFREIVVSIDGKVVGAVWPFAVLYTGGVNPLFWRPAAAIGAFNLPSYDIDITPFVGQLVDGQNHTFSLSVTNNLDLWLLQGNLHIWVDPERSQTTGSLVEYDALSHLTVNSTFQGLDGTFVISASRSLSYAGFVASSFGNLTTSSSYAWSFYNSQVYANETSSGTVHQLTETRCTVVIKNAEKEIAMDHVVSSYPLFLYYLQVENPNNSVSINSSIVHGLEQELQTIKRRGSSFSSLKNDQSSQGFLYISPNNTISGIASTQQNFTYVGTDGCFQRALSVKNYSTLYDSASTDCLSSV